MADRPAEPPGAATARQTFFVLGSIGLVVAALYLGQRIFVPLALAVLLTLVLGPVVIWLERRGLGRLPAVLSAACLAFLLIGLAGWAVAAQVAEPARRPPGSQGEDPGEAGPAPAGAGAPARSGRSRTSWPRWRRPARRTSRSRAGPVVRVEPAKPSLAHPTPAGGRPGARRRLHRRRRAPARRHPAALPGGHPQPADPAGRPRPADGDHPRAGRGRAADRRVPARAGDRERRVRGGGRASGCWRSASRTRPCGGCSPRRSGSSRRSASGSWPRSRRRWPTSPATAHPARRPRPVPRPRPADEPTWSSRGCAARSVGLAPVPLLLAVTFWTGLWGVVGLVLATPVTVCLAVLGKHVRQLRFLAVLLSQEAALRPAARYYQRLLARDRHEAEAVVKEYLADHPAEDLFDRVLVPALVLVRRGRKAGELRPEDEEFILRTTREIVAGLEPAAPAGRIRTRPAGSWCSASRRPTGWTRRPWSCSATCAGKSGRTCGSPPVCPPRARANSPRTPPRPPS